MDAAANLPLPLPRELAEPTRLPLGSLLLRDALLTAEQLEQALTEKDSTGRRLGEIVVGHGWVPAATVAGLLAEQHGLEYVDLAKTDIEPAAAGLLPEKYARRYEALPLRFVADDAVLVAVADPTNVVASDDLRLALGLNVRVVVAAGPDLATAIERTYRASLCTHCREPYWPEEHELAELGLERPSDDTWLYRPVGCVHCSGTGFTGRVALYEVMTVQGRLRRLLESGSTDEIFAEAVAQGMMTLRQDGIRLALEGVSSLDEVRRVTGDRLV